MYARFVASVIEVGSRAVGPGHPCLVIAEIGVNHNGDLRLAHQLIDAAAAAHADAVKFQTFTADLLASKSAPQAEYQRAAGLGTTQGEMLASLALDEASHVELRNHAVTSGLLFISSPFDEEALNLITRVGVGAVKVPSGELTNHRLLRRIAATNLPVLMSTGMSTLDEVDAAVAQFADVPEHLALLHCVSAYPTDPKDCNLLAIGMMAERYGRPVGWSDHTQGVFVAVAAVALGACIVEKHITLDRSLPGPDHRASIEPAAFAEMIAGIREAEEARGEAKKSPAPHEGEIAAVARKSLHWKRSLTPGDVISGDDVIALRPGTGVPPSQLDSLLGRRVRVRTEAGTLLRIDEVEPSLRDGSA